jgi:site-specific DNA-methyltransferase (adenine-specific)
MRIGRGEFSHGDCFDVMAKLPSGSVDRVLCDLPYGTTQNKWDSVLPLERLWAEYWRVCKPNAAVVLTATQPFSSALVMSCADHFRYEWVWHKSRVTGVLNAKRQPLRQHEIVLVFCRQSPPYNAQGVVQVSRKTSTGAKRGGGSSENYGAVSDTADGKYEQTESGWPRSVLPIPSLGKTVHPTQKPVALFEYLIRTYTNEGDLVLDNTAGSGTTAIAAENAKRRWVCIERDDKYFAAATERVQKHVGGVRFDEIDLEAALA